MSKAEKLRRAILESGNDANISFEDLRNFLKSLGFEERFAEAITVSERMAFPKSLTYRRTETRPKATKSGRREP